MDAGSKHIGIAATTEKKVLYAEELKPRNDVIKLLSTKRQNRRARRNRKTRYREARFDNRVSSKQKGWIAPSVEVKIQEHISAIAIRQFIQGQHSFLMTRQNVASPIKMQLSWAS